LFEKEIDQWIVYSVATLDNIIIPLLVHIVFLPKEQQSQTFIEENSKKLKNI